MKLSRAEMRTKKIIGVGGMIAARIVSRFAVTAGMLNTNANTSTQPI
jgi:hypothetical protein